MSLGLGIDIGATTIKVCAIKKRGGGLSLEHYRCYDRAELDPTGKDLEGAARELSARLTEAGFRSRRCVIGVSGRDAIIRYLHLPPMPDWRLALLMQFEVEENADRIGEPISSDYRVLGTGSEGNLVLIALAKDARVQETVSAFEAAGFEVTGAVPECVASADAYRFLGDEPEREITLMIDVGQTATEIALLEEGELIFARSVAQGGDTFRERLEKTLNVSPEDAEKLKRSGKGDKVERTLKLARNQFAATVRASVEFARRQLKRRRLTVERVVVAGGGSRVAGLLEALKDEMECEVEAFDALQHVERGGCDRSTRERADASGLEAATAAGLALSAVVPGAIKIDLLPLEVKERLHFRHRTLWIYGSAALLVATLLISFALTYMGYSGEAGLGSELGDRRTAIGTRLSDHDDRRAQNDLREGDLRQLTERARPGFHFGILLRRLAEATPPEVTFSGTELVHDKNVPGAFRFVLNGLADDSQQRAGEAMKTLREALERDARIEIVSIQPQGDEGHSRRFLLTVVPAGNPRPPVDAEKEDR
ncbi:MAG: pilus assembly protein PilM [Planctomycetes bacterium]|nr:pilus assembly protein PilM [Planctomycetota bacterium]